MRSERGRTRRDGTSGFSILELALLLALLTVGAAIAIPLFFGHAAVTLDNAALLLARDLRAAQNAAVFRGTDVVLQFLPRGDGYRVYDEHGVLLSNPTGGGEFVRRYSRDGVFEGVGLELLEVGPGRSVRFTPHGVALDSLELHVHYEGERRRLTLEPGSGLVSLEGLHSSWRDDGR